MGTDAGARVAAQRAAHLEPVEARQHHVEHDDAGHVARASSERFGAAGRDPARITRAVEIVDNELGDVAVVLDDQDVAHEYSGVQSPHIVARRAVTSVTSV